MGKPRLGVIRHLPVLVLVIGCATCGAEEAAEPTASVVPLFEHRGALSPGAGRANHEVTVAAGDAIEVVLTSAAFDPRLEVTPPGAGTLTNDDWQGRRDESRLSLVVAEAGALKITVASGDPRAAGEYLLLVRRRGAQAGAPILAAGGAVEGELGPGDETLPDGRFSDRFLVAGGDAGPLELRIEATGDTVPLAILLDPVGRPLLASVNGVYAISQPGPHRLQLLSPAPGRRARYRAALAPAAAVSTPTLARSHHQLPPQTSGTPITLDSSVRGRLGDASDVTLPTGEPADLYLLTATEGQRVRIEQRSSELDTYLMVIAPDGRHWENDDAGGTTNSMLDLTLPVAGTYRVVATAYRAGMSGAYELDVRAAREFLTMNGNGAAAASANGVGETRLAGELAAGDETLSSGEYADTHVLTFGVGERVHLEARSSAFDTYLIVRTPGGQQHENDDGPGGGTDAVLDFVAAEAGEHRVIVTSYRAGETGPYELVVGRAAGAVAASPTTPEAPTAGASVPGSASAEIGETIRGRLAAGGSTLQTGEIFVPYQRTFPAGQPVRIRLSGTGFDPYLIVRTPSGRQLDNDDVDSSTRDAGIDIPAAEAGTYRILATSYRPGETGAFELRFERGASAPRPSGGEGSGRVFGLFAGITDYPPGVGDLPECANDAIRLAQTLRESGLLEERNQIVLTDAQATRANLTGGLRQLTSQMGPDDVFVFFFSGHGGQTESTNDPREIDGKDEFLVMHDGPLLDDDLAQQLDPVRARLSLFAIDACHAGGFAKDLITRPGRVGFFSSEEDVLSAVASQFQAGGYLSHFLRLGFAGEADLPPRDGVLTVGELSHFLRTQFARHANDVELQGAYQHLVVDRGAVSSDRVLWSYR